MDFKSNPDYETLKLLVIMASALIGILLTIVGYFMSRQINVQESLTAAVTELTSTVKTMSALDEERYPILVHRLENHGISIHGIDSRLTALETTCSLKHQIS